MAVIGKQQIQPLEASGSRTAQRSREAQPDARLVLQRAQVAPGSLRPADILQLQRAIGNQATGRLLSAAPTIQAKMEVGPVNDVHEQEADRVAREVVRRTSSPQAVQENGTTEMQRQPLAAQISGVQRAEEDELEMKREPIQRAEEDELEMKREPIQRAEEDELEMKRETVQRAEGDELEMKREPIQRAEEDELEMKREVDPSYRDGGALDGGIEHSIRRAKGGGQSLEPGLQRQMESGFGASFGGVRIHRDAMADKLTRSVQAKAFTAGKDIFFKRGEYNPGSSAGKELLAHELTHTVQQGAAGVKQKSRGDSVQRALTKRAKRAFAKAEEVDGRWSEFRGYTDKFMPTNDQDELSKLRSLRKRAKKSPEDEKRLKDYLRAYLLSEYADRLNNLYTDPLYTSEYDTKKKQNKKRKFYFGKAKALRDKYLPLVDKGAAAPETQAFLIEHGFQEAVTVKPEAHAQVLAKGPRIDVRSTYIGGKILGMGVRAHLFIVYTGRDGRQMFFRGGPDLSGNTVAHSGPYTPSTVDYDPSAPSVTLLEGPEADSKLDALIEATSIIDGMKVPYQSQIGNLLSTKGENCNSTAWTILTRAGIKPNKPSGRHPGWGSILGSYTPGKEKVLPEKETFDEKSAIDYKVDPKQNVTDRRNNVLIYRDRHLFQVAARVGSDYNVRVLNETDEWRRILYHGGEIGYLKKVAPPPILFGGMISLSDDEEEKVDTGRKLAWYYAQDDSKKNYGGDFTAPDQFFEFGEDGDWTEVAISHLYSYDNGLNVYVKTDEYQAFLKPAVDEKKEIVEEGKGKEEAGSRGKLPAVEDVFVLRKALTVKGTGYRHRGAVLTIAAGKRIIVMDVNGPDEIQVESETPGSIRGITNVEDFTAATAEDVEEVKELEEIKEGAEEKKNKEEVPELEIKATGPLPTKGDVYTLHKSLGVTSVYRRNFGARQTIPAGKQIIVVASRNADDIEVEAESSVGIRGTTTLTDFNTATTKDMDEIEEMAEEVKIEEQEKKDPLKEAVGEEKAIVFAPVDVKKLTVYDKAVLGQFPPNATTDGTISAGTLRNWLMIDLKDRLLMLWPKMSELGYQALEAQLNAPRAKILEAINGL